MSVKPSRFQSPSKTPDFDKEAADAVAYEGLPPLEPRSVQRAIFTNVNSLYVRSGDSVSVQERPGNVIVNDGKLVCSGECLRYLIDTKHTEVIDLKGGHVVPGLAIYGPLLGLAEIRLEPSITDDTVFNPLVKDPPAVLGGVLVSAIDGLQFGGRDTL